MSPSVKRSRSVSDVSGTTSERSTDGEESGDDAIDMEVLRAIHAKLDEKERKVLRDLQVNCEERKNTIIELKSQRQNSKVRSYKKARVPGRSDREKTEMALMQAAKKFGFEKCAFLGSGFDNSITQNPDDIEDDQDPLHLPPNTQLQLPAKALATAYRVYLPPAIKAKADDEDIAVKFIHFVGKYKGEMATRLKNHYAEFLDSNVLNAFREDGHTPLIKKLIGLESRKDKNGKEVEVYEVRSPLLYGDPEKPTFDTLFANPTLPKIMRCLLYGPKSVASLQKLKCYGSMWGYTRARQILTPESMAFTALGYLFLLSKDRDFVDQGSPSGINYLERFLIWSALAAKLTTFPKGRDTLKRWHDVVFKGVKHKKPDKPEEVMDGLQDLVKEIEECAQHERDVEELATKEECLNKESEEGGGSD